MNLEPYIPITLLNDFIFCPRSIYCHFAHGDLEQRMLHRPAQTAGRLAHESIDSESYSSRKDILMGSPVYSERYGLMGKIDIYEQNSQKLIERKNRVNVIYDGYVFQVYAQYFGLVEMGYPVKEIIIRDRTHNRNFSIPLPEDDAEMLAKFENTISKLKAYDLNEPGFTPNKEKCLNCIYSDICEYTLC